MRILVLGSAGFIGKPFCEHLRAQGEEVVEWDIRSKEWQDARDGQLNSHLVDYVYFLAWDVGGSKYLENHENDSRQLEWNTALMFNVFTSLKVSKTPFTFISSSLAGTDTPYGVSKRMGEMWTHALGGSVVRLYNVYGAYEPASERSHVVADLIHQTLSSDKIIVNTTGEESRKFTHIDDVCAGLVWARGFYSSPCIIDGEQASMKDVAEGIARFAGRVPVFFSNKPAKLMVPGNAGGRYLHPVRVPLRDGLERTVQLYKEGKNEPDNSGI